MAKSEKLQKFLEKMDPVMQRTGTVCAGIWRVLRAIILFVYDIRKVFLVLPVAYGSWRLAVMSMERLPEQVGLFIQSNGHYLLTVSREVAVYGPVAITAVCLLMVLCSRRVVYPWVISIFSLVIPFFVMLCTVFPG